MLQAGGCVRHTAPHLKISGLQVEVELPCLSFATGNYYPVGGSNIFPLLHFRVGGQRLPVACGWGVSMCLPLPLLAGFPFQL